MRIKSASDSAISVGVTWPRCTLLVQQSAGDQRKNLPLAKRQRLVATLQVDDFRLLFSQRPMLSNPVLDRLQKILLPERLGQELDRPSFHRTNRHRDIAVTSDKNNG